MKALPPCPQPPLPFQRDQYRGLDFFRKPFCIFVAKFGTSFGNSFWITVSSLLFLTQLPAGAQTSATSPIVGYNTTTCLGGSDTFVSIPFHRAPVYSGVVSANVSFANNTVTVQAGNPTWVPNSFVGTHYIKFTSGAAAGLFFEFTANTATSFSVNTLGFGTVAVRTGDRFQVIPHWTLATLLPPASQTALHPSTGHLLSQRGSEVHFFESNATGVELTPELIFYITSEGWFQSANGTPASSGHQIIRTHAAFVIRHKTGASNTVFSPAANVDMGPASVLVASKLGRPNDNIMSLIRPIPVRLADLGLTSPSFVPSLGTLPTQRRDELLVYDNSVAALNKSEARRYFLQGTQWKLDNQADFPVSNDQLLPAGSVLVIRKFASTSDQTVAWRNTPTY